MLPLTIMIHTVFCMSLLESVAEYYLEGQVILPLSMVESESREEFEVVEVRNSVICQKCLEYLVRFIGYECNDKGLAQP